MMKSKERARLYVIQTSLGVWTGHARLNEYLRELVAMKPCRKVDELISEVLDYKYSRNGKG